MLVLSTRHQGTRSPRARSRFHVPTRSRQGGEHMMAAHTCNCSSICRALNSSTLTPVSPLIALAEVFHVHTVRNTASDMRVLLRRDSIVNAYVLDSKRGYGDDAYCDVPGVNAETVPNVSVGLGPSVDDLIRWRSWRAKSSVGSEKHQKIGRSSMREHLQHSCLTLSTSDT